MTYARSEVVEKGVVATYHCIARCVRRAFLCGEDEFSGKSFEHRREWIRSRLSCLAEIFAVEVIAYSVMSNHLHSVIKVRPDLTKSWTNEEVAKRWLTLFPRHRKKDGTPKKPTEVEIVAITVQKELVELYRERLSDISWFNRCLNENIAKRANFEDRCKGRFWEGRFKCQRIYDVAGVIACSAYVDLNPVRAGMAKTPEKSDHTSIQDRIFERGKKAPAKYSKWTKVPLLSIEEATEKVITLDEYLKLVDETGRVIVEGKASISPEIAPILERLEINETEWVSSTEFFREKFRRIVGTEERLKKAAKRAKKSWFHGIRAARALFGYKRAATT